MIDITAEEAQAALDKWVDIMRINFWDIKLSVLPEPEYVLKHNKESNANVSMVYIKLHAEIDICASSEDSFEYCLVHELVHVMLGAIDNYWEHAIDQCHARDELNGVRDHEMEKVTHQLARAFLDADANLPAGASMSKKGK